jgi:hypothetical protein
MGSLSSNGQVYQSFSGELMVSQPAQLSHR